MILYVLLFGASFLVFRRTKYDCLKNFGAENSEIDPGFFLMLSKLPTQDRSVHPSDSCCNY